MAAWKKCEEIWFALVLKRSFPILHFLFSENKVHILIPWHPFDIKINFIEFRMSGISKFRSKYKTGSTRFSSAREALSTSQKIDSSEYHCWIITIINVFLCQSNKERHVRIGEIFISPILKLFRQTCWITSRLIDHVGGRESPNYVTRQHRRITHQTHDDIVLRSNKQNKTKTYAWREYNTQRRKG